MILFATSKPRSPNFREKYGQPSLLDPNWQARMLSTLHRAPGSFCFAKSNLLQNCECSLLTETPEMVIWAPLMIRKITRFYFSDPQLRI